MASKPRPKWEEAAGPVEEGLSRWSRQRVQRPWGGNSKGPGQGSKGPACLGEAEEPAEDSSLWPACHMRGEPQCEGQRLHWR